MAAGQITVILGQLGEANTQGWEQLAPLVYDHLRRQASRQLRRENADSVLQTSALVNEMYLRLVREPDRQWQNREHFYAGCAQVMRRILVDASRRRKALRRGGAPDGCPLENVHPSIDPPPVDWQALHEALERLAAMNERQHRIVELRYFVGLTFEEVADMMGVTTKTIQRDWTAARTWLYGQLAN